MPNGLKNGAAARATHYGLAVNLRMMGKHARDLSQPECGKGVAVEL
jgi:hypothetical protein